ncbi:hypothetical protein [Aquaspirillum serpens]|nr:hypothetical protein [Aquaspirillum serpens]
MLRPTCISLRLDEYWKAKPPALPDQNPANDKKQGVGVFDVM